MSRYPILLLLLAVIITSIAAKYYWDPGNSGWSVALGVAGALTFLGSLAGMAIDGRKCRSVKV